MSLDQNRLGHMDRTQPYPRATITGEPKTHHPRPKSPTQRLSKATVQPIPEGVNLGLIQDWTRAHTLSR